MSGAGSWPIMRSVAEIMKVGTRFSFVAGLEIGEDDVVISKVFGVRGDVRSCVIRQGDNFCHLTSRCW